MRFSLINSSLKNRNYIFILLLIGKLILLPIIYFSISFFDYRTNSLFLLGDFKRYESYQNFINVFNLDIWDSNVGYMILVSIIKSITNIEIIRLIFYSLISLLTISYAQSIILDIVFSERSKSSIKFIIFSLSISLINFYILIYSFKPSTDVFGCLGIAILIDALIKSSKKSIDKNYSFYWCIFFLILCLFRNTLFLIFPFLFFTDLFRIFKKEFFSRNKLTRFFYLLTISFLLIINLFQFIGYLKIFFNDQQMLWGIASLEEYIIKDNWFIFSKNFIIFIFEKIIFLLTARETVGMTGDWFANSTNGEILTSNPIITNISSAFLLLLINGLGLLSIFRIFSSYFYRSFLFSLIPLLPLLSYASHHRYFLPYSLITSACLPFLFENFKTKNRN